MKPDLLKSIERLEPAAFTIVMGTGALSIATKDLSEQISWLAAIAYYLNICNFLLFIFLLLFAFATWPFHGREFHEDLDVPHRTAFYSAIGISFLVLSAQCLKFNFPVPLALCLWFFGALLTLIINFAINFHFFVSAIPELRLFTPVFFIPVGGLMVIPVAGCPLMSVAEGFTLNLITLINTMALGGGFLIYVGIFCMLLQRHYLREHLPDNLAPTVWIHLAPIGWGGVSIVNFAEQINEFGTISLFTGRLLWGGCAWWLIMCILLTLRAAIAGHMKFTLAYWAFIFPLGSLTILSYKLGAPYDSAFYFCWCLMSIIWCVAAFFTVKSFLVYLLKHGQPHIR